MRLITSTSLLSKAVIREDEQWSKFSRVYYEQSWQWKRNSKYSARHSCFCGFTECFLRKILFWRQVVEAEELLISLSTSLLYKISHDANYGKLSDSLWALFCSIQKWAEKQLGSEHSATKGYAFLKKFLKKQDINPLMLTWQSLHILLFHYETSYEHSNSIFTPQSKSNLFFYFLRIIVFCYFYRV